MKRIFKDLILFVIFGLIYFAMEFLWKGYLTHWTMFVLGGFIAVLIGGINEKIDWDMPIFQQGTIGLGIAVVCEAVAGILLNIILGLHIWEYRRMTFFWGQCSLPFCAIWLILAFVCIFLDDFLRWKLFGEEKPHYRWR